jgi:hypothetical protein
MDDKIIGMLCVTGLGLGMLAVAQFGTVEPESFQAAKEVVQSIVTGILGAALGIHIGKNSK